MLDYPQRTFSREAIRRLDAEAIERYGIPGIVLMENASRGVACHTAELLARPDRRRVLVLCGGGNNGGDGLAAARHLHNMGVDCTACLTRPADRYHGDAGTHLAICRAMGLRLIEAADDPVSHARDLVEAAAADVIIDALMGTGLSEPVRPPLADLVAWLNDQSAPVLAVDIPTGLDCDTGEPLGGLAVKATLTATMVGPKRGFSQPGARAYTGDVCVVDIGAPRQLILELGEEEAHAD